MAANMDTTGTFNIAKCFNEHGMFTCIHKHYSLDEWKELSDELYFLLVTESLKSTFSLFLHFSAWSLRIQTREMRSPADHDYFVHHLEKTFANQNPDVLKNIACSSGTSDADFEKIQQILDAIPGVTSICLDIANGYSEHFVAYVRKV